jgi:hypothetical protein
MTRSAVIRALSDYLVLKQSPVPVLREVDEEDAGAFPYAMVRAGTAEGMGGDQAVLWEINALVGVFHDAEVTTTEAAEEQAEAVFALLADAADFASFAAGSSVVISGMHYITTEAVLEGMTWRHIAGFTIIAAPASS